MRIERRQPSALSRLCILALAPLVAPILPVQASAAECTWLRWAMGSLHTAKLDGVYLYYNGRLANGETVRAILQFDDCAVTGEWLDSMWFQPMKVRGEVSADGTVTLRLYNAAGNRHYATLKGRFFKLTFYGSAAQSTQSGLSRIFGGISTLKQTAYLGETVSLSLSRTWSKAYDDRYSSASVRDPAEFTRRALTFWRGIRDHNITSVAASVNYPLRVTVYSPALNATKPISSNEVVIKNPAMLRRDYNSIFNWYMRDQILSFLPFHMRPIAQGPPGHFVSGYSVQVVFNSKGEVTGIG